jgi:outer membrane protein assembly factor BamE
MRRFRYDVPHYRPGFPFMRPLRLIPITAAALLLSALAGGCIYRMDIQQGNLLDADQVEQVEVGMTRSQVRFLLGTPMVIDSFNPDRWDYVYRLQRGHKRKIDKRHLIVWFESEKVARIVELIPVPRKNPA